MLTRLPPEILRRYQAYLYYSPEFERFSEFTDENTVNHNLEGSFQYNFMGGLSIDLVDRFIDSHDIRGETGITGGKITS